VGVGGEGDRKESEEEGRLRTSASGGGGREGWGEFSTQTGCTSDEDGASYLKVGKKR